MKIRVIDALQLPQVLDGSKWFRLPVPVLGTGHTTTDHELPAMTIGVDPTRKKACYCDQTYEPRAVAPSYFGMEAAFTLDRLLDECKLVDAKRGEDT